MGEAAAAPAEAAVWAPVEESEAVPVTVVEEPEKVAAVAAAIRDRLRPSDHGDGVSQNGDDDSVFSDAAAVARLHN
jgi:hypothetical protein